jgi:hypothetical protein
MLPGVRIAPILLALALALPALGAPDEQAVNPIVTDTEQRVDPIAAPGEQRVEALGGEGTAAVEPVTPGPVNRVASGIAKGAIIVVAVAVGIGTTVAALLFL